METVRFDSKELVVPQNGTTSKLVLTVFGIVLSALVGLVANIYLTDRTEVRQLRAIVDQRSVTIAEIRMRGELNERELAATAVLLQDLKVEINKLREEMIALRVQLQKLKDTGG